MKVSSVIIVYDGYAYGYIFVGNITEMGGTLQYNEDEIANNSNVFKTEEALNEYNTQ